MEMPLQLSWKSMKGRIIRGVVGDLSGTFVDAYGNGPVKALQFTFDHFGVKLTESEARMNIGNSKRNHIKEIFQQPTVMHKWRKKWSHNPTQFDIERVYQQYLPIQRKLLEQPLYSTFIPTAVETLTFLRSANLKIGATTGYTREMVLPYEKYFKTFQAENNIKTNLFDCICASDDVKRPRPFPDGIFYNLSHFGLSDPRHLVKVGDTSIDIEEGNRAGCVTVGVVAYGNGVGTYRQWMPEEAAIRKAAAELRSVGADYVISTLADLKTVLLDIKKKS